MFGNNKDNSFQTDTLISLECLKKDIQVIFDKISYIEEQNNQKNHDNSILRSEISRINKKIESIEIRISRFHRVMMFFKRWWWFFAGFAALLAYIAEWLYRLDPKG